MGSVSVWNGSYEQSVWNMQINLSECRELYKYCRISFKIEGHAFLFNLANVLLSDLNSQQRADRWIDL